MKYKVLYVNEIQSTSCKLKTNYCRFKTAYLADMKCKVPSNTYVKIEVFCGD